MVVHDFSESIIIGQSGEELILDLLRKSKKISQVVDLRDNKTYRDLDIDFGIKLIDGTVLSLELKTDTYDSGNIFYETDSCKEYKTKGCMDKTKADILLYYFTQYNTVYVINRERYVEWIGSNVAKFKSRELKNNNTRGFGEYTSVGRLIPIWYMEKYFKYYKKEVIL